MGVLERLFGRSKASKATEAAARATGDVTEEPVEEAVTAGAGPEAEVEATEAGDRAGAGTGTETTRTGTEPEPGTRAAGAVAVTGAEPVEIPRQQSADEVADSESGENARS
ncbi:hypothetical protein [Streptomyces antibioticus]|uniref:hypothetical protein n=1 Tax=Streptomyces antibioticus TaxID=1890 RepID=UPI0036B5914D